MLKAFFKKKNFWKCSFFLILENALLMSVRSMRECTQVPQKSEVHEKAVRVRPSRKDYR